MAIYRPNRNIEASMIDFLDTELKAQWSNIKVEKTFARIYGIALPSVCVRVGTTSYDKVEIGSETIKRNPQVLIDIFCKGDGLKLDIIDYIISKIKSGMPYYEYVVVNGAVQSKTENGRIRMLDMDVTHIDFGVDKNNLDVHDRYRALITCSISLGKIE
ncbi:hypothetical protein LCGC14_2217930 [marine sediment metagenome]|uniref:Uncharacterized protein n=1 Tax=marine sediment metagenome TaxID=412755 RepID=A0A0F9FPE8_9ZZZZ